MQRSHQVGRLVLEMNVPAQEGVHAKQDQALEALKKNVARAIERVFDKYDRPGIIIRIDRLELDFEDLTFASIDDAFVEAFEKKLGETLSGLLAQRLQPGRTYTKNTGAGQVAFKVERQHTLSYFTSGSGPGFTGSATVAIEEQDVFSNDTALVIFFLKNGYLPWQAQVNEDIRVVNIVHRLLSENRQAFVSTLRGELKNLALQLRLARHFPASLLKEIVASLFPAERSLLHFAALAEDSGMLRIERAVLVLLKHAEHHYIPVTDVFLLHELFSSVPYEHRETVKKFFSLIDATDPLYGEAVKAFAAAAMPFREEKKQVLLQRMGTHAVIKDESAVELLLDHCRPENNFDAGVVTGKDSTASEEAAEETGNNRKKERKPAAQKDNQEKKTGKTKEEASREEKSEKKNTGKQEDTGKPELLKSTTSEKIESVEELLAKISREMDEGPVEIDEVYVNNAGLVIVQPFLQPFFRELGLLDGKEFPHEAAQHRAVYLLHYIATGSEELPEEHELLLEKLLCGVALTAVLERPAPFTAAEKEECDNLLNSVISHWGALKKSTPEGLRQAFIKRSGKLLRDSNGWTLRIERNAFDVLLEKLPWGISIVKSPWNKEMIFVEW